MYSTLSGWGYLLKGPGTQYLGDPLPALGTGRGPIDRRGLGSANGRSCARLSESRDHSGNRIKRELVLMALTAEAKIGPISAPVAAQKK